MEACLRSNYADSPREQRITVTNRTHQALVAEIRRALSLAPLAAESVHIIARPSWSSSNAQIIVDDEDVRALPEPAALFVTVVGSVNPIPPTVVAHVERHHPHIAHLVCDALRRHSPETIEAMGTDLNKMTRGLQQACLLLLDLGLVQVRDDEYYHVRPDLPQHYLLEWSTQQLGEVLYVLVARVHPHLAGKITGMLLELNTRLVVTYILSNEARLEVIDAAVTTLSEAAMIEVSASRFASVA
jgi:hypothetical protein